MAWAQEKQAGFLLAALLAEDRSLDVAGGGLAPAVAGQLRTAYARAELGSREQKARTLSGWLRVLRPELGSAALALPPRVRTLLSRAARPPLKAQLQAGSPPMRADFSLDGALMGVLLRIARHADRRTATASTGDEPAP